MTEQQETVNAETPNSPDTTPQGSSLDVGRGGILGIKLGMYQTYEKGEALAVTAIGIPANVVTAVRSKEKGGYQAVQVAILDKKEKNTNKAEKGRLKSLGRTNGFHQYREFRMPPNSDLSKFAAGQVLNAGFLKAGDLVDAIGISKGKGFQGVMKRYNYAGGFKSHGASLVHRSIGSIGNRADPGKVFKGKKMAGQMGNVRKTLQNLLVVRVDTDKGFILVKGSIPGPRSGIIMIRKAIKPRKAKVAQAAE